MKKCDLYCVHIVRVFSIVLLLLASIGLDTAENEPPKGWGMEVWGIDLLTPSGFKFANK